MCKHVGLQIQAGQFAIKNSDQDPYLEEAQQFSWIQTYHAKEQKRVNFSI